MLKGIMTYTTRREYLELERKIQLIVSLLSVTSLVAPESMRGILKNIEEKGNNDTES